MSIIIHDKKENMISITSTMLAGKLQPMRRIVSQAVKTTTPIIKRWHGGSSAAADAHEIKVSFLLQDGETKTEVTAKVGDSFLEVAHRHEIDLEGACEGVCACSTCHLIYPTDVYDSLEYPEEEEEDMLDMAFGLTETSRLGCQVIVTEDMDGIVVEIPKATRNFYVDGHKPKPH
jgi:ferredoxin